MGRFVLMLVAILTVSCYSAPRTEMPRLVPFNEDEYLPYAGDGDATITGQAFLKTRGGDVKYGAGNTIFMNPVTSYSTEWMDRAILGGGGWHRPTQEP
jgi:hypothetical protein